jgi:hypothetical protein
MKATKRLHSILETTPKLEYTDYFIRHDLLLRYVMIFTLQPSLLVIIRIEGTCCDCGYRSPVSLRLFYSPFLLQLRSFFFRCQACNLTGFPTSI